MMVAGSRVRFSLTLGLFLSVCLPQSLGAQGTLADYERADSFNARTQGLVVDVAGPPQWIGETGRFWYRNTFYWVCGSHGILGEHITLTRDRTKNGSIQVDNCAANFSNALSQ